jgi:hypothetical protein
MVSPRTQEALDRSMQTTENDDLNRAILESTINMSNQHIMPQFSPTTQEAIDRSMQTTESDDLNRAILESTINMSMQPRIQPMNIPSEFLTPPSSEFLTPPSSEFHTPRYKPIPPPKRGSKPRSKPIPPPKQRRGLNLDIPRAVAKGGTPHRYPHDEDIEEGYIRRGLSHAIDPSLLRFHLSNYPVTRKQFNDEARRDRMGPSNRTQHPRNTSMIFTPPNAAATEEERRLHYYSDRYED